MATRYKPKTKPFPHQARATLRAVRESNMAFFMEPRCGKTKAVLDAIAIQAIRGQVRRVVVVCPLSAISVWEDEIQEHFTQSYRISQPDEKQYVVHGPYPGVHFFLLNYDKFRQRSKDSTTKSGEKRKKPRWVYEWARAVEDWHPDLVVLDESHRAKRAGAVTAQILWRSVARMRRKNRDGRPFVYLMTGTPNPKGYQDIFAQYRIMDPTVFGTAKDEFEEEYCVYGMGPLQYRIIKYRNKGKLLRKIQEHAFIISRDKAFPDGEPELPPVNVRVKLPAKAMELYREVAEEGIAFLEGGETIEALHPATIRLRCQQITGGFTTDGVQIHDAKLAMARDILSDLSELRESVVVYCRFLPEVHAVHRLAQKAGFRAYEVYGAVSAADRAVAVRRLAATRDNAKGGRPVCLVFQVATGSLALDLSAAGEAVFYSLPDSFTDYWQAVSRLHGPKQTRAVRVRHLLGVGTVDLRQLGGLRDKSDLHAELMGNPRGFLFGV